MWPTSGSNSNQWSLNPAAYQNVPYEQVDWATLAQQWIKMKETIPSVSPGLPPPPAPQISKLNTTQASKSTSAASEARPSNDIEGGEAPMDMDTNDDDVPALGTATGTDSNWKQWNDWQSQWGWGWQGNAGTSPLGAKTSSSASTVNSKVKSPSNDSNPVLNNYVSNVGNFPNNTGTTSTPQVPGSFNYNKVAGGTIPPTHPKTGYYSESSYTTAGKPTSSRSSNKNSHQKIAAEQYLPVMDAAKKKKLPAWIREGLNKMEREKQKKMEYERLIQEKLTRSQLSPEKAFKSEIFSERIESPASSPSVADEDVEPSVDRYQKSRSSSIERGPPRSEKSSGTVENSNIIRKTKDQIMEESMLKVRRILTEFLLEATENQVATIAKEELRRIKRTAPAPQIRKSNALTCLSGNLGLAAYDSDSASTDSERDVDNRETDSDDELAMLIEKKKRNFALIEDRIEEEIESQENKERQVVQRHQELENQDGRSSKFQDKDKRHSREDSNSRSRSHPSEQDERGDKKASKINSASNNHDKPEQPRKSSKSKKRTRSSSSSSSSSESSRSTESGSSISDRSASKVDSGSSDSRHSRKKKDKKRPRKKNHDADKVGKRAKRLSESRSPSRSRYSRDEKRQKNSSNREQESNERKRSSDRHRKSDNHHERSSSYRRDSKDSRDSSTSKYRETRERDYGDSKRKGRRSRSRDSRRYSRR